MTADNALLLAEYEIYVNDELLASVSGTEERAKQEILHYAAQYQSEGVCEIYRVTRKKIPWI